jgi:hypothetical protein
MPFKSEAQRRKFAEMVKQGKITKATYDAWNNETPKRKLPEHVPQRPKKSKVIK